MNHTRHIEFILLWLTDNSPLQIVVFVFLLLNYMLNVTGDLIIIVLTLLESHLKTPMYISLHNFSFLEISFTSSCTPRFPITTVTREIWFLILVVCLSCFSTYSWELQNFSFWGLVLWPAAICKPLRYTFVMSSTICPQLVLSSWATGFLVIFPPVILGLHLDFCDSNVIDHFICDISPILHLSFSDTHLLEMVVCWLDVVTLRIALLLVILSYSYIIKTIISFSFSSTAKKFIFTCSLHKIVVCISYCSCIFIY